MFFTHWQTHIQPSRFFSLEDARNPINAINKIETHLGAAQALSGLSQAVNDTLEMCEDWPPDLVSLVDQSLAQAGSPTLTNLRHRRSRKYKSILRRGRLRDDSEFYLVTGILSDTTIELPESEREVLDNLVGSYESQRA